MAGGNEALIKALAARYGQTPQLGLYQDSATTRSLVPGSVDDPFVYAHLQGARNRDEGARQQYLTGMDAANNAVVGKLDAALATPSVGGQSPSVINNLLATEEGARALLPSLLPGTTPEQVESMVTVLKNRGAFKDFSQLAGGAADATDAGFRVNNSDDFASTLAGTLDLGQLPTGPTRVDAQMAGSTRTQSMASDGSIVTTERAGTAPTTPQMPDSVKQAADRLARKHGTRAATPVYVDGQWAIRIEYVSGERPTYVDPDRVLRVQ